MKTNLIKIKKANKRAFLRSVRISQGDHNYRRAIVKTDLPIPHVNVVKDVLRIREEWSLGYSDLEIRKRMGLTWRQWKKRMDTLRAVPPQDDTIKSFERYFLEHSRYVAKLQLRQRRLNELYDKAIEEIESRNRFGAVFKRPRDLELARATMVDLATVDKDLIKAEQDLVLIKQKLGIIDQTPQKVEITGVFNVGVLEQAWALRKKQQLIPIENPDQKPYMEGELLIEPPENA